MVGSSLKKDNLSSSHFFHLLTPPRFGALNLPQVNQLTGNCFRMVRIVLKITFLKDSFSVLLWLLTRLKSAISSFKICFQNYGQLLWASTFLTLELSRLSGPMLKTQKNAKRNQFEQHWFNVISYQKPPRVYRAT